MIDRLHLLTVSYTTCISMVSIEQWRAAIGGFNHLKIITAPSISCKHLSLVLCCLYACIYVQLLVLLLSGDVETNPGPPYKLCPQCSTSVNIKKAICECGFVFRKSKTGGQVEGRRQSARLARKTKLSLESPQEASCRKEQNKLAMTRKRILESPQEASYRKEQNKLAMTTKRILESPQEASYRKEQNKLAMTTKRILESPQDAFYRREQDKLMKSRKRILESPQEASYRKEQNKLAMTTKRILESPQDAFYRREQDKLMKSRKRILESPQEASYRKKQNKLAMTTKRILESPQDAFYRREQDKLMKSRKQILESPQEASYRKEQNKLAMTTKRILESPQDAFYRREQDKLMKSRKRILQSPQEASYRKEQNKLAMTTKRILESPQDAFYRREQDKLMKSRKRILQSPQEASRRKEQNKLAMTTKRSLETKEDSNKRKASDKSAIKARRASSITIENAITAFLTKVKIGPEFVCTSCHRMMYKKCVVPFNRTKYKKPSFDVLNNVFCDEFKHVCSDGKQWVCKTCDSALTRGNMPLQAKANGLQLQPIPPELSSLNALELRLISLRIPFMKMVALPSGKQCCIHGPAVNVPSKLDTICTLLPRLPSQTELIPLKLKRKLQYKGHYMYNYVRPDKVMNALIWLKANNPLYANISINNDWINESLTNDTELFTSLTQQPNEIVKTEGPNEIVNTEELNDLVNKEELNELVNTEEPNELVNTEKPNKTVNTEELNEIVNTGEPNEIVNTEELNEIVNTEEPNEIVNTVELNEIVNTEEPELTMEASASDQLDIITNAYKMLSSIAQRNGYNIHDVAADVIAFLLQLLINYHLLEYIILIYMLLGIM